MAEAIKASDLLEKKFHLEGLLHREPANHEVRRTYFANLIDLSRHSFGIFYASLPEIAHPLAIRANTSDVMNFRQIFLHQEYGFEFPHAPRRILDLGAYAGYAAVFFANRFPTAQIACVEPSTANLKILSINTQAYDNIEIIPGAAWHRPTFLAMSGNVGGHWGTTFSEQSTQTSKLVRAYTVYEMMDNLNWPDIDLLKCDIEGAELELFSAPDAPEWLERVHIASVETHDRFRPGSTAAVEGAFRPASFIRQQSGEFYVYRRVSQRSNIGGKQDAGRIELFPNDKQLLVFDLRNVPAQEWGFMMIGDRTFQLHPQAPGCDPSEIRFSLTLSGQKRTFSFVPLSWRGSVFRDIRRTYQRRRTQIGRDRPGW